MISKKRLYLIFLEALLITLIIYMGAFFLNNSLDFQRINDLNSNFEELNLNFYSSEISNLFLNTMAIKDNKKTCKIKKEFIYSNFVILKKIGSNINNYGALFLKTNKNFSLNEKRKYFLNEISIYNNIINYNSLCNKEKIMPVIYFFDGSSNNLDKQALILSQFSINNKNKTIILSFDINYKDEPILNSIKKKYNIVFTPFIILNNKTTRDLKNSNFIVDINTLSIENKKFIGELK